MRHFKKLMKTNFFLATVRKIAKVGEENSNWMHEKNFYESDCFSKKENNDNLEWNEIADDKEEASNAKCKSHRII